MLGMGLNTLLIIMAAKELNVNNKRSGTGQPAGERQNLIQ